MANNPVINRRKLHVYFILFSLYSIIYGLIEQWAILFSSFFWQHARLWIEKQKEAKTWISLNSNTSGALY
jgi:hypothetical protein